MSDQLVQLATQLEELALERGERARTALAIAESVYLAERTEARREALTAAREALNLMNSLVQSASVTATVARAVGKALARAGGK